MTRIAISGHRGFSADVEVIIDLAMRAKLSQYASNEMVACRVWRTALTRSSRGLCLTQAASWKCLCLLSATATRYQSQHTGVTTS
jgi:hypothetical protein